MSLKAEKADPLGKQRQLSSLCGRKNDGGTCSNCTAKFLSLGIKWKPGTGSLCPFFICFWVLHRNATDFPLPFESAFLHTRCHLKTMLHETAETAYGAWGATRLLWVTLWPEMPTRQLLCQRQGPPGNAIMLLWSCQMYPFGWRRNSKATALVQILGWKGENCSLDWWRSCTCGFDTTSTQHTAMFSFDTNLCSLICSLIVNSLFTNLDPSHWTHALHSWEVGEIYFQPMNTKRQAPCTHFLSQQHITWKLHCPHPASAHTWHGKLYCSSLSTPHTSSTHLDFKSTLFKFLALMVNAHKSVL